MKGDKVTGKSTKKKTILAVALVAVLACVTVVGVLLGLNKDLLKKPTNNGTELAEMPKATASDEKSLRELLLEESIRTIEVDEDIEIDKEFIVKGKKTLVGDGELRMALHAEWGQALLVVSEGYSLTMDGLVLNGNYVSDGIHMEADTALTYLSGTIKRTDSYGILAQGNVEIKDINVEWAEYIAVYAKKGSTVNITGGTWEKTATNDLYIDEGATVTISGDPVIDGCMGDSIANYGTLNVHGGTFSNANSYVFNNYGTLNATYKGKEDGAIECTGARLGVFCTRKDAKTTISGVYVHDTQRQGVVTVGGETKVSDSTFERTGYHSIEIQTGKATIENVTVKESQNAGLESYTDADVTIKNFTVEACEGIGISSRGAKITGSDIKITDAGRYGVACGNSKNGKASIALTNTVVTNPDRSGFYVYSEAEMTLDNVQVSGSKSRGIYIEDTASCILSGKSIIRNNEYRGIEARGQFVMNDGEVYDNKVKNSGAGVYVSEKGNFTMNGGSIYDNFSALRGGGICVTEGTVTINKGDIYNNAATDNGGGLYAQKTAVVTLKKGSIKNNKSELYGDGIYMASAATKVTLGDQFYLGGNDVKLGNVETALEITGNKLANHSASDPLLLTPDYSSPQGTVVATCTNANVAKSMAVMVKSGDGSYNVLQDQKNFVTEWTTADMDMTGADTVYVSNFQQLKEAVLSTTSKRNIVLRANIVMEERLRLPGGVTIRIQDDGTGRTLTRDKGLTDNFFVTHYGTGLILEGTELGKLVLDGTASDVATGSTVSPLVRTAGSTVLNKVVLQNNGVLTGTGDVRGALMRQLYGDFKIVDSLLANGSCNTGGALMLDKGTGYIAGTTFSGNQSVIGGGAIRVAANTTLEIVGSTFTENRAGSSGGAIVALAGSGVTITDTKFVNNTAVTAGGALNVQGEGATLVLIGSNEETSVFENNSSKKAGAINVTDGGKVEITKYKFNNNSATAGNGGVIAAAANTSVTIADATLTDNKATGDGGAIYTEGKSEVAIVGSTFAGNSATLTGGAINIQSGAKVTSKNSAFTENTATGNAGAVYCAGTFEDTNSSYTENTSARNAGAIIVTSTGQVTLTGTDENAKFSGNEATTYESANGGAIYVNGGKLEVTGYAFDGNSAKVSGGGIFVAANSEATITDTTMTSNKATNGGGIYASTNTEVTIVDVTIANHAITGRGGAVYNLGKLECTNGKFENNSTSASKDATGGAIYAGAGSDVTLKNCEFTGNTASNGGGAIHILTGEVTSVNSTFSENTTTNADNGSGGAIYCQGTYIDTNSAYTDNQSARHGGAIFVSTAGSAITLTGTDTNAKFSGNSAAASADGNAIYVNSSTTASITNYTFAEATQKVMVAGTLTFDNITGTTLKQGTSGVLKVAGYKVGNELTIVLSSYAEGKVVLVQEGASDEEFKAACENITITPDASGNEWFVDENGQLQKEEQPGEYVARIGDVTYETFEEAMTAANAATGDVVIYLAKDVTISKQVNISKNITITNEPGVDITITRSANVTMFYVTGQLTLGTNDDSEEGQLIVDAAVGASTRIVDNRDNATFILGKNATLQSANNNQWGCTVINRNGTVELYGDVINNTCTGDGGAILQHGANGTLTIYGGNYTGNKATKASTSDKPDTTGGLGCVVTVYAGKVEIKDGIFSDNSTVSRGGVLHARTGSTVVLSGGTFSNNKAGEGGDIYSYVPVEIAGLISDANGITFTPSEYAAGKVVLTEGDTITNTEFQVACAGILVTSDANGNAWAIDKDGKLQKSYVARIGDQTYSTFKEAIDAANNNGGTGSEEDIIVYVNSDVTISAQVTISKNITITNEPGRYITLIRDANVTMFYVTGKLTLGTNGDSEQGQLIVDGGGEVASSTRIVDNRDNATFILGKNATLQNANNNQWGSALINRNATAMLYGNVKDNICTSDGGAILQHGANGKLTIFSGNYTGNKATNKDKSAWGAVVRVYGGTVEIKDGIFSGNSTAKLGSVLYVASGTTATISGGIFKGNTAGEGGAIYSEGTLEIAGPITADNGISVTLKADAYKEGQVVLTKTDAVTVEQFKTACVGVQVTPDADGTTWSIDENGKLKVYAARVGDTYYESLVDAITAANTNGGTGNAEDIVVYVRGNAVLTKAMTISKNVTIRNEAEMDAMVTRTGNITMFTVNSGARLTFGTNNEEEQGKFIVDGATPATVTQTTRIVDNKDNATFILGRNATLQHANNNQWGSALINRNGTAALYGNVVDNICSGDGGAILQHGTNGTMTIYGGSYTGNQAPGKDKNAWGAVVRVYGGTVEIKGGTFSGNSAAKLGGVLYVASGTTAIITGGTFKGNTASTDGNAIYIVSGGKVIVTGGEFATEDPAQEIYVAGTLEHKNLPESLIKKAAGGTVSEIK